MIPSQAARRIGAAYGADRVAAVTAFRIVRLLARLIYQLSGLALIGAVVALVVSGLTLALIVLACAIGGWVLAQVMARIAVWLFVREGGDPFDLETGLWRWR